KKGTKAYVTFELTNQIGVFNYLNNVLTFEKTINLTTDETKNGSAAELRLSKDENFLYTSVRGNDNFIAVIKLGNEMKVMQRMVTNKCPRNFILTKDEQHILVANQLSNTVIIFDRNIKTGLLTATSTEVLINKPVYLCRF
ncbi:MAG: beta-propeller fold lactonase family protein, partial [Flavobacterium sp.]|nr:beta-propeller fold lactonase family protein [Flavobacterium sp.]